MTKSNRREFLHVAGSTVGAGIALSTFPPAIRKALAIPAHRKTGTLKDVEHVVILTQENRSFDHYFGTLPGVRGFGDRFPIPVPDTAAIVDKNVWYQPSDAAGTPEVIAPFRLDTEQAFEVIRVEGTPHSWPDAQHAWADGRMNEWPLYKRNHSMGYFARADIPFQVAMAEAFTLCDDYHCSFMGGTNSNRLFLWSGTNDPLALGGGPSIDNRYDNVEFDPSGGYTWLTYCERLEAAGISWQVYENYDDNFTDNSLAGFRSFRDAFAGLPGANPSLLQKGLATRDLDKLLEDVLNDQLPQVSWIVATAEGSEHPGPSSPAQGADYTARVLEALTANPEVWSKTVLLINFDENDGFFDHVPPPAAPSYVPSEDGSQLVLAGESSVDTTGEYHEVLKDDESSEAAQALRHKPYGLGPRVPLYVISPWSKGGWVNSQVFDHTSVIRFLERRFGVVEPNISPWRRAVCGDLTSAFNFDDPDNTEFYQDLPDTVELAERARALPGRTTPATPALAELPIQDYGTRPSRALPYVLHVGSKVESWNELVKLRFANTGGVAAVFHVYDRLHLDRVPRRYTVEPSKKLFAEYSVSLDGGAYDLWVLGPNGFHRHFKGHVQKHARTSQPEVRVHYHARHGEVEVKIANTGDEPCTVQVAANAYFHLGHARLQIKPDGEKSKSWALKASAYWYDFSVTVREHPSFLRRFAGRLETGRDSLTDPAMGGIARGDREV